MLIRCPTLVRLTRCLGACQGQRRGRVRLTMPLLVLLAFGAFDYGSAYVESVRLNGAARAGAQQSMYNSNTWEDTDQAEQAALEEYVGHALTPEEVAAMSVSATAEALRLHRRAGAGLRRYLSRRLLTRAVRPGEHDPRDAAHPAVSMGRRRGDG